ncbi:hypothetical protein [Corynebacterium liangguodongii]|nr:hypothetical protein [Corynebacterium liangguodongii]
MVKAITNDPYAGMTWEERDAALAHDHEMSSKCPPLDYVESLQ